MSFPTTYVPALAMASIVVVMIVTSIARVQGIVGDGGGGMAMGVRVDDVDIGDGGKSIDATSDNGPTPLDEWTMRIRGRGDNDDDDDDDDGIIIEGGYSSSRILQGIPSQSTTTLVDAPAPAPTTPDVWAPGDVLVEDATMMP